MKKLRSPISWMKFICNPENVPAVVQYTTDDGDNFKGAIVQAWDTHKGFVAVWNPADRPVWVRKSRLHIISKGTVL